MGGFAFSVDEGYGDIEICRVIERDLEQTRLRCFRPRTDGLDMVIYMRSKCDAALLNADELIKANGKK